VPVVQEGTEFIFSQLRMLLKEKLSHKAALGEDTQYGFYALELLLNTPNNSEILLNNEITKLQISTLSNQKDEEIILPCVKNINTFTKNPKLAEAVIRVGNSPLVITECVNRLLTSKDVEGENKENHLCARLLMIDRVAVNRNIFNKTKLMDVLIQCWNDCDNNLFTTNALRYTFRAMRRIVSDAHVETLLKNNVINRLIVILNDEKADIALLPDVLFLLGSLAVVPEIK
ncbi:hypothetical protein IE077_003649, partial [Cardiosporidium cionae]